MNSLSLCQWTTRKLHREMKLDHYEEPVINKKVRISDDYEEIHSGYIENDRIAQMDAKRKKELDSTFWLEKLLRTGMTQGLPDWVVLLSCTACDFTQKDFEMKMAINQYLRQKHGIEFKHHEKIFKENRKFTKKDIYRLRPFKVKKKKSLTPVA
jgi:hypothetical protein